MSLAQESRYGAEADVLVKEPPSATAVGAPERPMQERVLQNELRRAQGSEIQSQVREVVGSEPVISVRLAASEDTDVFIFRGESADPELAAEAANVYAQVYIDERRDALTQDLLARAEVVQERLDRIAADLDGADEDERVDLLVAEEPVRVRARGAAHVGEPGRAVGRHGDRLGRRCRVRRSSRTRRARRCWRWWSVC